MAKVFISYDFSDKHFKSTVANWEKQNEGKEFTFVSEDEHDWRDQGYDVVKQKIKLTIDTATILLLLVGDDCHNRPWLDFEIQYAKERKMKTIWVRIPDTTGAPPVLVRNINPTENDFHSVRSAIRSSQ